MTTRPPRVGEVDGVDYHFATKDRFMSQVSRDRMLEWTEFNHGWYYGTPAWEIIPGKVNIAVLNPEGFYNVCATSGRLPTMTNTVAIYLDAPLGLRLRRSYEREGKFQWQYIRRAVNDFRTFHDFLGDLDSREQWKPYGYTDFAISGSPFGRVFVGKEKSLPEDTLCDRILCDIRKLREKGVEL